MKTVKRMISVALAAIMLLTLLALSPVTASAAAWQTACVNAIERDARSAGKTGSLYWWLRDFDDDGIPELLFDGGETLENAVLHTFNNGSAREFALPRGAYQYAFNKLHVSRQDGDAKYDWVYRVENGGVSLIFEGIVQNGGAITARIEGESEFSEVSKAAYHNYFYNALFFKNNFIFTNDNAGLKLNASNALSFEQAKAAAGSDARKLAATTVTLSNKTNGMRAEWNKVAGAGSYIVYYKSGSRNPWQMLETKNNYYPFMENSDLLHSVLPIYVQVQAVGVNGIKGNYSKVKSLKWIPRAAFSSMTYNGSVNIRAWTCGEANAFQIAKTKYGSKSYEYYTYESGTWSDKNVRAGESYTYQVRGMYRDENGSVAYGAWSASKSVCALAQPASLKLSNKSNGIRAEWSKVAGAAKYRVYYKQQGDTSWSYTDTANTYYPLLGTKSGVLYYVQVQTLNKNGVGGGYSAVKSMTFIAQPQLVGYCENDRIWFYFTKADGANAYQIAMREVGETEYQYAYLEYSETGYTLKCEPNLRLQIQVRALYATQRNGIAYGAWSKTCNIST